ncbi:GGDEF domain-containing protein [Deinococcus aquiradiocola]|uniref:GGDEF domain-containing protein n=1 Tax=Deinococcus aquiradiocola TaxID=393059 RepID=A0A917URX5_9DEIO|nr:diguanylate cyclase [Deinococcus aquiradiocola]GGJ80937.1 GGDEF domain-containing protein [Deinococcus aquiradiocola]
MTGRSPLSLELLDRAFVNFTLLIGMVSLLGLTYPYRSAERATHRLSRWGLLTCTGLLLLGHAVVLQSGVLADLRFLPVALATMLGGPLYGLSVSVPTMLYRAQLGGAGVWPSVLSVALTVGVSVLVVRVWRPFQLQGWPLYRLGLIVTLAGNLPYLLVPGGVWPLLLTWPVKAVGLALAVALLQTRLRLVGAYRDYRRMAYTDKLTGLLNRRRFDEDLRPGQSDPPSFLLLLDLDHFKSINDAHGHDFGDKVLAVTAQVLRENLRHWDGAYRYGGEEFAVLLRHCTPQQARMVAERVRASVERTLPVKVGVPVTVSIGAVTLTARQSAQQSVKLADRALYRAKHRGRNRVEWGEATSGPPTPSRVMQG